MRGTARAAILAIRPEGAQARLPTQTLGKELGCRAGHTGTFRRGPSGRNLVAMSDSGKPALQARRKQRLAAALRENLKRRKAQARQRGAADTPAEEPDAAPHDSAGIRPDKQAQ
jgi:hypothetical protein